MKGGLSKEVVSDEGEVSMGHTTFVTNKAGLTKEVVSQKSRDISRTKCQGGHIETCYTLGGASHVPICSHAGGYGPSQGGQSNFQGGQNAPPAPLLK